MVVLIIGILAAVALPQYTKAVEKSRAAEAKTLLANLATAEQVYKMANGAFTGDLTALDIQLPGVGSVATIGTSTKNFNLSVTGIGSSFSAVASRITSPGTPATGNLAYSLELSIDSDGSISRKCYGSEYICKSIGNGRSCDNANVDWCYESDSLDSAESKIRDTDMAAEML